jgi:hypothetical protein
MELVVTPSDLHAAAVSLAGGATRLDAAGATFVQAAHNDVPDIGAQAAAAAGRGVTAAQRAVQVMVTDIRHLSDALSALAAFYPQLDASVVPEP